MDPNEESVRSFSQLVHRDKQMAMDMEPDTATEGTSNEDQIFETKLLRRDSILSKTSQKSKENMKAVPTQLALKITVLVLFLIIVSGLGVIFHFHSLEKHMLTLSQKIHLNEDNRVLTIESNTSATVLIGKLGIDLPDFTWPYDCSNDHDRRPSHKCLRWGDQAQVDIYYESKIIGDTVAECHNIHWQDLSNFRPRDCYLMDGASWFGGGLLPHKSYPFGLRNIQYQDFLTSLSSDETGAGQVLEPVWFSTKGASIIVEHSTPLAISVSDLKFERSKQRRFKHIDPAPEGKYLCLLSDISPELKLRLHNKTVWLNYTVCASSHVKAVQQYAMKYKVEKLSPVKEKSVFSKLIFTPVHLSKNFTQDDILDYAERLYNAKMSGIIMMLPGWEAVRGDFTFDKVRFQNVTKMMEVLHGYGFQVNLPVHPYVSVHSKYFGSGADRSLFVPDGGGVNPGLTRWKCYNCEESIVAVLDVSNPDAVLELQEHITTLKETIKPDFISFFGGDANSLPYMAHQSGQQINLYTEHYSKVAANLTDTVWLQVAFSAQGLNPFILMPCDNSSWEALRSVTNRILTVGLIGYPNMVQGIIGGCRPENTTEELYIRWLQLGTFMPLLHFSGLPAERGSNAAHIASQMLQLHDTLIKPTIVKLVETTINNNWPLVRPLWWQNPNSPMAFNTTNQFLVGDNILVAPVLHEYIRKRDIYLPNGKWKDGWNATTFYVGPKWLRQYPVPLEKIPYFIRS